MVPCEDKLRFLLLGMQIITKAAWFHVKRKFRTPRNNLEWKGPGTWVITTYQKKKNLQQAKKSNLQQAKKEVIFNKIRANYI